MGPVTVPENEPEEDELGEAKAIGQVADQREPSTHTELQWRLLKLGSDMGLDVWVAKNDKGKDFLGHGFCSLPGLRKDLPLQFDEVTNRTIELIDVLWIRGNAIVAAFESKARHLSTLGYFVWPTS